MGRRAKPTKGKAKAKRASAHKPPKGDGAKVRDLEKCLAEALEREAAALSREAVAHEKQAATADILRVISSSPTDVQPVFDAIVRAAVQLCHAVLSNVQLFDGQLMHFGAQHSMAPVLIQAIHQLYPMPPNRSQTASRAVLDRAVIHVPDVLDDKEYLRELAVKGGFRSVLSVPMMGKGRPIGAITVGRMEAGLFSETEITLLQTFADQAVIAIENVRLFTELQDKNEALTQAHAQVTESLEQQTATAEILRVISSSPTDVTPVLDRMAESATRFCLASDATIWRLEGDHLVVVAHHGPLTTPVGHVIPYVKGTVVGRSVLERQPVHVVDLQAESEAFPEGSANARRFGHRTILSVPLLREGGPLGAITLRRAEVVPFTAKQITLLLTFADQAVIAIENVRLFTELQTSNRELRTALDTQTATSDILRVISSSQTDVQPVFDAILASAVRLLGAYSGSLTRRAGDQIELVALTSTDDAGDAAVRARYPRSLQSEDFQARALRDRAPLIIADAQTDARLPEATRAYARARGWRSAVMVPMLRPGEAVGTISVTRRAPGGFTDDEIALLKTFADQAVIAIENVRLFKELDARNHDLTETLEQQTATSEVLKVISRSAFDLQPVFETLAEYAVRLCDARRAFIFRVDGEVLRAAASYNASPELIEAVRENPIVPGRHSVTARAALERRTVHIADVQADAEFSYVAGRVDPVRTMLSVPMLKGNTLVGVMTIFKLEVAPFTEKQIALVETFADQAVIAIENVRLFKELEARNRDLTEALTRQTSTSEILRVISSSPTDVQPVFDAIARNAVTLCGGMRALVLRFDGERLHVAGHCNMSQDVVDRVGQAFPRHPGRDYPPDQALLDRSVVHVPDLQAATEFAASTAWQRGVRSLLAVPLLREQEAVGVISVARDVVGPFSPPQIEVLQTFADQAVIAIENVRLFNELRDKNGALTEALEQQTATAEILRVISSSPTDPQPVFDAIVRSTLELCGAKFCVAYRYDGVQLHVVAHDNLTPETVALLSARYPQPPSRETATGVSVLDRRIVHIPDATGGEGVPPGSFAFARAQGWASLLAVPLLRDGQPIGNIAVARVEPGPFTTQQIALVRIFADQAVIAIENVRLFRELEQKSRELEAASRHKSEFLANMSHELRTPLNAVIGFSEVLTERMFGELNDKQDEYLRDITASGQHLLSLINDILDLSKIEAGRMELELSDFDLPAVVDNALMLVRERAGRRGIALAQSIGEGVGAIRADERKVRQVLLNLLSNALKFTPEGGRVDVAAALRDKTVEVSVADTGVGIAPEDQEAVFEEFRQVGTADKKVEGTGLGLTLSRKFIELHGGRIWVESQVGHGSTFTFTLPVRRAE